MEINIRGHVVNNDGETTQPTRSQWWVGDSNQRIAFDFLKLDDGNFALHSFYGNIDDQKAEDFLYEVVAADEAEAAAESMVTDAIEYLIAEGAKDFDNHHDGFVTSVKEVTRDSQ